MPNDLAVAASVQELVGRPSSCAPSALRLIEKCVRDVKRLKQFARWVLIIDADGKVVNSVQNEESYVANVIAVLGPAVVEGCHIPEAVLLEVGVSRGRPYTEAMVKSDGQRGAGIKGRRKFGDLTQKQLTAVWPMLVAVLEECILAARAKWKTKGPWITRTRVGLREYERGIYFSIAERDSMLHEIFLRSDVEARKYLARNAQYIKYFLRRYQYVYYPEKQLKSLVGVQKVVDLWHNLTSQPRWSSLYAHRILQTLPRKKRDLFKHIAQSYGLRLAEDARGRFSSASRVLKLPPRLQLRLDGAGKTHGKGCSVFEVFFSKEYRESAQI